MYSKIKEKIKKSGEEMTTKEMIMLSLDAPIDIEFRKLVANFQSFTPFIYSLVKLMKPERVFEWGMGQSTHVFLMAEEHVMVTTHEEHQKWADKYTSEILAKNPDFEGRMDMRVRPHNDNGSISQEYLHPDFPDETFDIVLVDGGGRYECAIEAGRMVRKGGVILIHDTQRQGQKKLYEANLNQEKVEFIADHKPGQEATSIWLRKNN